MIRQFAVIIFALPRKTGRDSSNGPLAGLPWTDREALEAAMIGDLAENASRIPDIDIILYRDPKSFEDDTLSLLRQRIEYRDLPDGSFLDILRAAIDGTFSQGYHRIIAVLENHPMMTTETMAKVLGQLGYEDDCVVYVPSAEGKIVMFGMKANHTALLEGGNDDILEKPLGLVRQLCNADAVLFPLAPTYSLESGSNLERLKMEIEEWQPTEPSCPRRTQEMFRDLSKKYRPKRPSR